MPDWLGYESAPRAARAPYGSSFLPFERARAFAHTLKLRSKREWMEWSKSGQRPMNIPGTPYQTYRDGGWVSWPDWLGYERQCAAPGSFLPFERGRIFVHTLKLKGQKEWHEWSKSAQRPVNIPSHPDRTYRDDGWVSWSDWLGYEKGASRCGAAAGGVRQRVSGNSESVGGEAATSGGEGKKRKRGTSGRVRV